MNLITILTKFKNVLIVGSGGREHCLGWKVSQNPTVKGIFYAPGNGGTEINLPISMYDFDKLLKFARDNSCLTIVGPEKPLDMGIVDVFRREQLPIFGPNKLASRLESSKVYAKNLMHRYGIPTAPFAIFSDPRDAEDYVTSLAAPPVVKLDGLAQGKGVVVSNNLQEAVMAVRNFTKDNRHEFEGEKIIIENRIHGEEISVIFLCDGNSTVPLASSQDHKRVGDCDQGPNTGGMGSYSPAPFMDDDIYNKTMNQIIDPILSALKDSAISFIGFLYAGLIIEHETHQPYVLEFNVRMGDPECQSIIPRMESDLVEYLVAATDGNLSSMPPIRWTKNHAVSVVMTSKGYPGTYETGKTINGLKIRNSENVYIFHSGTVRDSEGKYITSGGRVLSVTALAGDIKSAIARAYSVVRTIHWGQNEEYYRNDIGYKALKTNRI